MSKQATVDTLGAVGCRRLDTLLTVFFQQQIEGKNGDTFN